MPATRVKLSESMRGITREALERGKLDRAAVRRLTGEAMKDLARARKDLGKAERLFVATLREAAAAGRGAASQSMNATLASGAIAARIAAGMLAGIADTLAQKAPRRRR